LHYTADLTRFIALKTAICCTFPVSTIYLALSFERLSGQLRIGMIFQGKTLTARCRWSIYIVTGPTIKSSRSTPGESRIPSYSLYGEGDNARVDLLHIEEIKTRSEAHHGEIKPHSHKHLHQFILLYSGRMNVGLHETRRTCGAGSAIFIPARTIHSFQPSPGSDGFVLSCSPLLLQCNEDAAVAEAMQRLFAEPGIVECAKYPDMAATIYSLLKMLHGEFSFPSILDSAVISRLAQSIMIMMARLKGLTKLNSRTGSQIDNTFYRFNDLVEKHYLDHARLEDYSSLLGLSVERLNRITQLAAGKSPMQIVQERLIREASRRLIYLSSPVSQIAYELGFNDVAYFCRFFKKRTGKTPSGFRNEKAV
jgi:AraC family transcriptional activator of pobA